MRGRGWLIILAIAAIIGAAIWYGGRRGGPSEETIPPPSGFIGPDSAPGVIGPTAPHP